jgi:hypothetical protein
MKLFGNKNEDKIEELEEKLQEKKEKIEELEGKLKSEENRRKKHTREKQEAERKVNRLEDKLEGLKSSEDEKEKENTLEKDDLGLEDLQRSLKKLEKIESDRKELVTVFSPSKLSNHSEIRDIRNSLPQEVISRLNSIENLLLFQDPDLGTFCFQVNPFYTEKFNVGENFEASEILDFLEEEKTWVTVSRGETHIYREERGEVEEVESVKSRVNREHGKGGFSQGRFERKRDEQIQNHLEKVSEKLENYENIYLLGDKALCKDLDGKYISGFDDNSSPSTNFYRPRRIKISHSIS